MSITLSPNPRRFRFFIAAVLVMYLLLVSSLSNNHILALNNGLALTPPMGWNSWNTFPYNPTDALIRETADAMVSSGMKDAGYQYINIDDGWWNNNLGPTGNGRDASGNIIPNPEKFPNGMKAVVDYIHSKGLKAGIYTDIGPTGCGLPHGSYGYYQQDANQFAAWGFDLVKLDACGGSQGSNHQTRYEQFRDALANTGRPIVFSICEWGTETPWVWGPNTGNYWRVGYDIDNQGSLWDGVIYEIDKAAPHAAAAGPGHWNDPDMMEVGVRGTLTFEENKAHFSMWAILAAPMIAGNDLRNMTPEIRDILTNSEVIAVDQDALGRQGTLAEEAITGQQVWSKVLGSDSSGRRAVALFNRTAAAADITVHWSNIGLTGTHTVRDLWQHSEKGSYSGSYTANVPSHGVVMLLIRGAGEPTYTPGPTSTPTPLVISYEAESSANTLTGTAAVTNKSTCSGGKYVGFVGNGTNNTLQFNSINVSSGGSYPLTIYYMSGEDRTAYMIVNGGTGITVSFSNIGNWDTVGTKVVTVNLVTGNNTIKFGNDTNYAPDFDRITLPVSGGGPTSTPTPTPTPSPLPTPIVTPVPGVKLTGSTFGSTPAYATGCEYDKVFDGNINTYFDYLNPDGGYAGIDLGTGIAKKVVKIRYYPRPYNLPYSDSLQRMVGGKFQGSNTSSSSGYTDLYTITAAPTYAWNEVTITNINTFRYLRYLGANGSYCNVAEVEFYSDSGNSTPTPAPTATATPTATPNSDNDDFGSGALNPSWSWIREDNTKWSLTVSPGYLRIITDTGDIWLTQTTMKNILLKTPAISDFTLTTKLTFSPTANYQQAGLMVYTNDDNFINVQRKYSGGNKFSIIKEISGSPTETSVTDIVTGNATIYLKLVKSGTTFTGYYSTDNATWNTIGSFSGVSLASPKVGLFAANGGVATNVNADFDYFYLN